MNKIEKYIIKKLQKSADTPVWFPYSVEETSEGLDEWAAASTSFGLFSAQIKVRQDAPHGTLEHEIMHVRQYQRLWLMHNVLYKYSNKYRLFTELQAFREHVRIRGYKNITECEWIIDDLFTYYGTGFTQDEIFVYASEMFSDLVSI